MAMSPLFLRGREEPGDLLVETVAAAGAAVATFAAVAIVVRMLATRVGRWWALVPVGVFLVGPVLRSGPPNTLISGWDELCGGSCLPAVLGLGAAIELALVVVAVGRPSGPRSKVMPSAGYVAAALMASVLTVIAIRAMDIVDGAPPVEAWVAVCLAGLMSPNGQLRPLESALLMSTVASTVIPDFFDAVAHPDRVAWGEMVAYTVALVRPLVIVAVASASWPLWLRMVASSRDHPLGGLIVINALNIADAVLTWIGVSQGDARELNPVVSAIGLPWKVILVAVVSVAIYRLRPAWLPYPTGVMLLVVAYHLSGLVING
jgi:hypothetical protein